MGAGRSRRAPQDKRTGAPGPVRSALGITSFGINAFRAPREGSHPRARRRRYSARAGRRSSISSWTGTATFDVAATASTRRPGRSSTFAPRRRGGPLRRTARRRSSRSAARRGEAFVPAPPEAAEAFAAYNEGDYGTQSPNSWPSSSSVRTTSLVLVQRGLLRGQSRPERMKRSSICSGRSRQTSASRRTSAPTKTWTPSAKTRASTH